MLTRSSLTKKSCGGVLGDEHGAAPAEKIRVVSARSGIRAVLEGFDTLDLKNATALLE